MKRTRRQTKLSAAAAAGDGADTADEEHAGEASPAPTQAAFVVPLPEDIDTELLSSLLPDTLFESPSPDDVVSLYRLLLAQATEVDATQRELEETKAEVERKDVELDQALQDRETGTKELETTLEAARDELKQAKQERDEAVSAKNDLQAQLASLSTSQTASSGEVETLKHRVEDVEREKRDLIGVVSRLKEDSTQREEEIQTLRSDLKQARRDQQALESQLRELRSTETSTKFKLDSLTQQLQLAKDEAERTSRDLTEKSEEYSKYRRTKHAELAQLQGAHDALVQTHTSVESTLKTLQSSYNSQSHQLSQALARVQDLNGQLAEQEATYSSEAAGLRRLIQMMEERESQAKGIVEGLEKEWAGVGERAERREAVLREEIDAQRERAEEAEARLTDLQKVLDKMDRGELPIPDGSVPGTPARGSSTPMRNAVPDYLTQGMMGLSPTVAIASRVQRGGKTFTEVYADYVKLQEEFAKKSMEYDHMDRTLSAVLTQIEERAPILAQQRQEYERLQTESTQLASQLSQALAERDASATAAADSSQKLAKSARENEFLTKQLDDLGRQIQTLLKELGRHQDPSIPSDEELEEDTATQPAENIEAVITNNLVLFRSIPGLQEQNQKLLKIVRELGAKMEAEEKDYRDALEKEQSEAVREAHEAIKLLQEQLETQKRSSELTASTYMKERDALKATLARERAAGSSRAINGINGHSSGGSTDVSDELVEVQSQFEAYKTEMTQDSGRLREDLLNSQRESATLGTALAKANAKIDYLNDRHRMLQEQTTMQRAELDNLSRRNQELYDQYTRLDIECNRYSEDLLTSKSVSEQLRNECANLRAEKKIWESVQSRLVEENRTLTVERSQLSDLMTNVQRMHSDLERSGENDRRRLEGQIQMLESQTQDLRTQLQQERDSIRHLTLQKDIELKELRNKLDKTTQDYSQTRESLAVAETSRKHLEEQVEQLNRQLKAAEEKLAVYERRPSGSGTTPAQDPDLSREQQLEAEVAELRAALKVAEVDLATARAHVQQFKDISTANEAALASLNATYDEYKSTTEAQITSREHEFLALEEKFDDLKKEHSDLQGKVKDMQKTFDTERTAWVNDKKTLEGTIFDMTTSEKSVESDRASRESEIRQQEERAKAAEERYSREVIAHAEAIKTVEELRQQLNKALTTARDNQAASETAQAKLTTSETSWKQQKEALDKEVADLNTRVKDLGAQNNLLHQHLESVSTQAARIRQAADSSTPAATEGDSNDDADTKLSELRSVVAYLRKEKEIVDLQLELSKQENLRLKTQIDHLAQNLEETRKTLSEERERAVEVAASEAQHAELVERINQLTILRESNATLRADCESHAKRARALDVKLQAVTAEMDPIKEQLRVARAELEAKEKQIDKLEDESQSWQKRNAQLLSKYDRIDPIEVQALRDQIQKLELEKEELQKSSEETSKQLTATRDQLSTTRETGRKNNTLFKTRFEDFKTEKASLEEKIKNLETQVTTLTEDRDKLKVQSTNDTAATAQQDAALRKELDTIRAEKASLEKQLADEKARSASAANSSQSDAVAKLTQERDALVAEKASLTARLEAQPSGAPSSTTEAPGSWEAERVELTKARDEALAQLQTMSSKLAEVEQSLSQVKHAHGTMTQRVADLTKARNMDKQNSEAQVKAAVEAAVQKVREEVSNAPSGSTDEIVKKHQEELRALEERLAKQHADELKAATDAAKPAEGAAGTTEEQKAVVEAAVAAAVAKREAELKKERDDAVAAAVESGRMEGQAKFKLKDSQLVRSQTRCKELEAQVKEWQDKGLVPTPAAPPKVAAANAAKAAAAASSPAAGPSQPKPTTAPSITRSTSTGSTAAAAAGTAAPTNTLPQRPVPARGRGGVPRGGVPRGGAPGRGGGPAGAAGGLAIRGAAPAVAAAEASTNGSGLSGGVGLSIAGASKRPREDAEPAGAGASANAGEALAKRLKPTPTGGPITLNRNRVQPPAPQ